MKFQNLTRKKLWDTLLENKHVEKIKNLNGFYLIHPHFPGDKKLPFKTKHKPDRDQEGMISAFQETQRANSQLVKAGKNKLEKNNYHGTFYSCKDASFKLHVSLNEIGVVEHEFILNFIEWLIKQAQNPERNLFFTFKIIYPELHLNNRFKNNDQITIYFDKYSSLGEIVHLSQEIDSYFKSKNIPENCQKMGGKDNFNFNSYVSGRYDHNTLNNQYDVYPFFDIELGKFISSYTFSWKSLEGIPIGALDAVFNKIITSDCIQSLAKKLSEKDSSIVQAEFQKLLKSPWAYLATKEEEPRFLSEDSVATNERDLKSSPTKISFEIIDDYDPALPPKKITSSTFNPIELTAKPLANRKVGRYGFTQLGNYFNLNIVCSNDAILSKVFDSVEVLLHGHPFSKHVIGFWNNIILHPIKNGQRDGATFDHTPDIELIIPSNAKELQNYCQKLRL